MGIRTFKPTSAGRRFYGGHYRVVPNGVTRPDEVAAAPETAQSFAAAVDLLLGAA